LEGNGVALAVLALGWWAALEHVTTWLRRGAADDVPGIAPSATAATATSAGSVRIFRILKAPFPSLNPAGDDT
jgi:hypothetical protein